MERELFVDGIDCRRLESLVPRLDFLPSPCVGDDDEGEV
jgi:hypothetical protein